MKLYRYVGYSSDGERVRGRRSSSSEDALIQELGAEGVDVEHLRHIWYDVDLSALRRVRVEHLTEFTRQMASLMRGGLTQPQALDVVHQQITHPKLKQVALSVLKDVRGGGTFSTALRAHPGVFPGFYVDIVSVAEATGSGVDRALARIARMLKRRTEIQRKIDKATRYPSIVFYVLVLFASFLLTEVLPEYSKVFAESGAELPRSTLFLVGVSSFLSRGGPLAVGGVLLVSMGVPLALKHPRVKPGVDRLLLLVPRVREIVRTAAMAIFCRTLATALQSDLQLTPALRLAADSIGNAAIAGSLRAATAEVAGGAPLASSLARAGVVPPAVVAYAKVGETAGTLADQMDYLAGEYEDEVEFRVDLALEYINPVMIVVVGGIMGVFVYGLYKPMYAAIRIVGSA